MRQLPCAAVRRSFKIGLTADRDGRSWKSPWVKIRLHQERLSPFWASRCKARAFEQLVESSIALAVSSSVRCSAPVTVTRSTRHCNPPASRRHGPSFVQPCRRETAHLVIIGIAISRGAHAQSAKDFPPDYTSGATKRAFRPPFPLAEHRLREYSPATVPSPATRMLPLPVVWTAAFNLVTGLSEGRHQGAGIHLPGHRFLSENRHVTESSLCLWSELSRRTSDQHFRSPSGCCSITAGSLDCYSARFAPDMHHCFVTQPRVLVLASIRRRESCLCCREIES